MSLELKNKRLFKLTSLTSAILIFAVLGFIFIKGSVWSEYDYKILDFIYKKIVEQGYGPKQSEFPQIKYVTINDDTYTYMHKNFLDRKYLAILNDSLMDLGVQSIAYDIIFANPSTPESDTFFMKSLENQNSIYLPLGLNLSEKQNKFKWKKGKAFERLKQDYLISPVEKGRGAPFFGTWATMQYDDFASQTLKSGHISAYFDSDGYIRHMPVLIKIEDKFLPTLSLLIFLDYVEVPYEKIIVDWGKNITIPSLKDSFLEKDVVIPIDEKGRVFIPFCQTWEKGFEEMQSHVLLEKIKDINLSGNLAEIFEGNFIFIGDISIGVSDLGNIPIQNNIPLIAVHASMLNGMLTNTFYKKWSFTHVIMFILIINIIIGLSALFRNSWILYSTAVGALLGVVLFTWTQFVNFFIFPIVTVWASIIFLVLGLIITIEVVTSKDRTFIRSIFARYVPEKIVTRLLLNPENIKLGGETRKISLMMSDLRGFTALASYRSPEEVILILNRYFEKMIDIIMSYYGVIDEIIGDGILAFFGAPEEMKDHSAKAVACALAMQAAMKEINEKNDKDGLPQLNMGIAVNTGEVVVGNIGSERRTKYGAVGSEVNFTGRAESYTIGGQVLITNGTYKNIKEIVQVKTVMEVEMKGMSEKVKLYDVTGIGDPFNVYLESKKENLLELDTAIKIKVFRLDDKIISKKGIKAKITHLSDSMAIITLLETLPEWGNIRFQIFDNLSSQDCGEVYAKVDSISQKENGFKVTINFTSVSSEANQIFKKRVSTK